MLNLGLSRRSLLGGAAAASLLPGQLLAQAGKGTPVTIANAAGAINVTMQQLIKQEGFLEEFGLAPNIMQVADGSKILGGILGGELDLSSMSGFGQVFPAIAKGGKMKIIGGAALLPSLAVFTSKPDVKTLKDLEGRTVGTGSIGALLHQLMVALLRKHNVDVTKVRFVNIGSSVDVFRGTIVGTVDAGLGEVTVIDRQEQFKVRLVEHGNMSAELTEFTYQGAWTSDAAIQKKRDVLVKTLAAYAKLYRFVHSPGAQEAFLKARKTAFPTASEDEGNLVWKYIQTYKPYAVDLVLSEERIRYMQQINVDVKVQEKVLPFNQVADMSIAQEALELLKKKS